MLEDGSVGTPKHRRSPQPAFLAAGLASENKCKRLKRTKIPLVHVPKWLKNKVSGSARIDFMRASSNFIRDRHILHNGKSITQAIFIRTGQIPYGSNPVWYGPGGNTDLSGIVFNWKFPRVAVLSAMGGGLKNKVEFVGNFLVLSTVDWSFEPKR